MNVANLPNIFQPFECDSLVRLGKNNDGGYLVNTEDVAHTNVLVAFGIGADWSFEEDFLARNSCALRAFDASVDTTTATYREFFVGKREHVAKNVGTEDGCNTFADIVAGTDKIFLKCDIEGGEYGILNDIIQHARAFTGMVIEFHHITNSANFNSVINFIAKVPQKLVHTHVNNYFYYKTDTIPIPDIVELSFTSVDTIRFNPELKLPHALDMPNNPLDEEFTILFS